MKSRFHVAFLVASFVYILANAQADDSFLNRELPTTRICYGSSRELLQILKLVAPKTIVLPEGISLQEGTSGCDLGTCWGGIGNGAPFFCAF